MSWQQYQKNRQKADKYNRKVVQSALKIQGITRVEFTFSGGHDDGCVEDPDYYQGKKQVHLKNAEEKFPCKSTTYANHDITDTSEPLHELVRGVAYEALDRWCSGWDTSNGADGSAVFDVESGAFKINGTVSEPVDREYTDPGYPEDAD